MKKTLSGVMAFVLITAAHADGEAELFAQAMHGPQAIQLKDQAALQLPAGYLYLPKEPAARLMDQLGNKTDERFLGLIFSEGQDQNWMVDVEYEPAGYVKDDDAKNWDADALLKSLKEGTEASNDDRKAHKLPALEVTGWAQVPVYESATHRLRWSATAREIGAAANQPQTINYNTYMLGREGYVSLNLITDTAHIEADKPSANLLLGRLNFNSGKRYEDFQAGTDHVAEYGLAALVAGVAAKKLGLLAMAGLFFAKFLKVIVVAAVAVFAGVRRFFGGKKVDPAQ